MALPPKSTDEHLPERTHWDVWRSVFLLAGAAGRTGILPPTYPHPRFLSGRGAGSKTRPLILPAIEKSGGMRHGATA